MWFEILIGLIIIFFIKGKEIKNILNLEIKLAPLICVSFLMQFFVIFLNMRYGIVHPGFKLINTVSYIILGYALYRNWDLPGIRLTTLGIALNFIAILLNGGSMAVWGRGLELASLNEYKDYLSEGLYQTHSLMEEGTNIISIALGDWIPIVKPHPRPRVISIGDIIMTAGVIMILWKSVETTSDK
jgi:hypothetical protein